VTPTAETWVKLKRLLDADEPPPPELYVRPKRSCADDIAAELGLDPAARTKILLVGARGGGKSTELRQIASLLANDREVASLDLDLSRVNAVTVTAFQLVYLSSVAVLRLLEPVDAKKAEALFGDLKKAYADGNAKEAASLGSLREALSGLASFATLAAEVATLLGGVPGGGTVASGALGALGAGIRLLPGRAGAVPETSGLGRAIHAVAQRIAEEVDEVLDRPLCVLVAGLEKINGQSADRFRAIFDTTRLLADLPWAMVFAAPPCTLSTTNAVDGRGFRTVPVWGFGPDDLGTLGAVVRKRLDQLGLNVGRHVDEEGLARLIASSGGLPRHAIEMMQRAATRAHVEGASELDAGRLDEALEWWGQALARGLDADDFDELRKTARTGMLSGTDEAAVLFADGRILVHPPAGGSRRPRFLVHPLLAGEPEVSGAG